MENVVRQKKDEVRIMTEADYYAISDDVKVELIDGEIYNMASPGVVHQEILWRLTALIGEYIDTKGGQCKVIPDLDTKLSTDRDTIVRPDISVVCDPDKLTEKRCEGSPDWIIEIASPGDPKHDYLTKLELYQRVGVREYWIVDPMKHSVIAYRMSEESFDTTCYTFKDNIPTGIYDDLKINFAKICEQVTGL